MTMVPRFSRQNDAGLRELNVALWENLVLVVLLVLESKGPHYLSLETYVIPLQRNREASKGRKNKAVANITAQKWCS